FESGRPFRQHRHGGARVDNKVERFANAFDHHLAAQKTTRGSSHREINTRTHLDVLTFSRLIDHGREISFASLPDEGHAARAVINCRYQLRQSGDSEIAIDGIVSIVEVPDVNRDVLDSHFSQFD